MSLRIRIFVLSVLGIALLGAGAVSPPAAVQSGSFGHGPVIVLVHGLGSHAEHWLPVARLLAPRHRVVLVDLPGHGESAMPAPFSLERATQALDRALARTGREPVVLVGHSIGGLVAAAEACEHPARVRALVLIETALRPQVSPAERRALLSELDADYQGVLHGAYLAFGRDSAQGEALYRQVAAMEPSVVKPWIRLACTADLSRRVARLQVPLLVVLAPRSWPRGEPWVETAAILGYGSVPRVRAARVDSCGHYVMLDRPDDLARLLERFADAPGGSPVAFTPLVR